MKTIVHTYYFRACNDINFYFTMFVFRKTVEFVDGQSEVRPRVVVTALWQRRSARDLPQQPLKGNIISVIDRVRYGHKLARIVSDGRPLSRATATVALPRGFYTFDRTSNGVYKSTADASWPVHARYSSSADRIAQTRSRFYLFNSSFFQNR